MAALDDKLRRLKTAFETRDRRGKLLRMGTAVLCGCLIFLATADFDVWPLAWFAPVLMCWLVATAPTKRSAILNLWLVGIVANTGGFYWISGLLVRFAGFPSTIAWVAPLALSLYQGLVYLLFGWALRTILDYRKARAQAEIEQTGDTASQSKLMKLPAVLGIGGRSGPPLAILAPVILVAGEMLIPFIFPWYLAITQAWLPPVIQIAEFTGPVGVTAMIMAFGGALCDAVLRQEKRFRPLIATSVIVVGILGWSFYKISAVESARASADKVTIGIVQGNIGFDQKGVNVPALRAKQLRDLQLKSAELERQGAELIVWTESSYPYIFGREQTRDFAVDDPRRVRRGFDAPIIIGALTKGEKTYNSALLIDNNDNVVESFDKIFLLMFGEYIPPWLEFTRGMVPPGFGALTKGSRITTFPLTLPAKPGVREGGTYRLGPLICYEDIIPAFGRQLAPLKPHMLVNVTNDAWFGDTSEPWEHMALSVFRSVEMRNDMIRSVNTGVSTHISATGKVLAETYAVDPAKTPKPVDGIVVTAALMEGGHTFYARYGDVFGWACVILLLLYWQIEPRTWRLMQSRAEPHVDSLSDD